MSDARQDVPPQGGHAQAGPGQASLPMDEGQAQEWLDSLPVVGEGQTFCFECTPEVPCFNRCCRQLTLPLTPYDVLRLRRRLGLDSATFFDTFATIRSFPDSGLPIVMLRMLKDPDETCPFVTPAGCHVYEDRPGACRSYPLGRGTKISPNGVVETFYLVREEHCCGFDEGRDWTPHEWFDHEALKDYNASNDRYMRIGAMVTASGGPVPQKVGNLAFLCLYQLDRFREFIETMRLYERVEVDAARRAEMETSEEALLEFAYDWVELAIFGEAPGLARKKPAEGDAQGQGA